MLQMLLLLSPDLEPQVQLFPNDGCHLSKTLSNQFHLMKVKLDLKKTEFHSFLKWHFSLQWADALPP